MKNYYHYLFAFVLTIGLLHSCAESDESTPVSKGQADFSTYVALGNSLTSGYADNALYREGQEASFANLLAGQLEAVGGGEFKQPLVESGSVGVGSDGNARLVLGVNDGELSPVPAADQGDLSIFQNSVAGEGPFNNMGVPGATVITAVYKGYGNPANGEGNFNPFFTRMTANPADASMLEEAVAQDPTFFTLFIGNNDVLGYATSGGKQPITPMDGGVGQGFSATYDAIVGALTANGAKGALANIPDVTSTPFFTYIPWDILELEAEQAAQLNGGIEQILAGMGLDRESAATIGVLLPEFKEGGNGVLVRDNNPANLLGLRQLKEGELVLLNAQSELQQMSANLGNANQIFQEIGAALAVLDLDAVREAAQKLAIPDHRVLFEEEVENIKETTEAYNQKIKSAADAAELAYVDVNGFLKRIGETGVIINGRQITTEFVTGGAFSLDGIHLAPMGNVLLANEFIHAINKKYDAFIPKVDANEYGGVLFPD